MGKYLTFTNFENETKQFLNFKNILKFDVNFSFELDTLYVLLKFDHMCIGKLLVCEQAVGNSSVNKYSFIEKSCSGQFSKFRSTTESHDLFLCPSTW